MVPYSLEERGINSKPLWKKLEKALGHSHYTCAQLTVSFTPAVSYSCYTILQRSHQIAIHFIDAVVCVLLYRGNRGRADNW